MPFLPTPQLHTRKIRAIRLSAFFAAIVAVIFVATMNSARAQTDRYWSGNGSSDNINDGNNWFNGTPNSGDNLYFNNTLNRRWVNINYGSFSYFGNLISYNGAGYIRITGDQTYLYTFENNNNGSLFEATATLANRTGPDSDLNINAYGSGGIAISNAVIQNGKAIIFNGNNSSLVNGVISQSGSGNATLTKNGAGVLTLMGANTYQGNTTINAGAIIAANNSSFGTVGSVSISSGASLRLSNASISRNITLNGDGGSGVGALRNTSGNNTWSGAISLSSGSRINSDSGTLTLSGGINSGANALYVGGSGNVTVGSVISGSGGSLFKDGAGVLTLSSGNTYTGKTTNNGGTISIGADTALGAVPGVAVADQLTFGGGTLAITTGFTMDSKRGITLAAGGGTIDVAASQTLSYGGVIAGSGNGLTKAGSGILSLSGANSYTGATTISAGTLQLGAAGVIADGSSVSITTGAVFDLNGKNETINAFTLNGTGISSGGALVNSSATGATLTLGASSQIASATSVGGNNGNITIAGAQPITNSSATTLTKIGSNTVTLSNGTSSQDNLNLLVAVNAGTLVLAKVSADNFHAAGGATVNSGGTLQLSGSGGFQLWKGASFTVNSGGVFDLNGQNQTFTNNGPSIGGTGISSGGALVNNNAGAASTLSSGVVMTNDSSIGGAGNLTISGNITNTGGARALIKVGAGTLTLSGANTYGGVTTVNSGVLSVGAVNNLGTNPTSGVTNQLTLNGGTLAVTAGFTANANAGLTVGSSGGTVDVAASQRLVQSGGFYGSGNFTKTGQGTLSLTNTAGAYAGAITVTNGTLQANTALRGANVSVGNSSTLNGSVLMGAGQVGSVIIDTNGRISPGNSVGILSVSNSLSFNGGGSYLWEITNAASGAPGTNWDLITVDTTAVNNGLGTLTIGGSGQFTVNGDGTGIANFSTSQNYTNDYFLIVRAANISGSLANLAFSGTALGTGAWTFSTNSTGLFLNYTAPGTTWVFNNSAAADQGTASVTTNGNTLNQLATITNEGAGVTAVVISNSAPMTFTNANNSYSGTTIIEQGTLVAGVNAPNAANGAFGNAATAVQVGSTNTGNSTAATLLIGNSGVTVGRAITVNSGGTGARTIGATNASGAATYSGNIAANTNVTLSASNSGGTTLFSGVLSGSGAITAAGSGTVVLSGANSYTNATTVNSNTTLIAANDSALGGGSGATTVSNGGTVALSNNINSSEALTIAGSGVGGLGALRNLSGANTNTGTVTLSADATIAADSGTTLRLGSIDNGANNRSLTFSNATNSTTLVTGNLANMDTTTTFYKVGTGSLVISNTSANTGGAQLQLGGGTVTLAAGTFSTNSLTSPRGLDLGLTPGNVNSTNDTAFYVNSGVTMSNTVYVAPAGAGGLGIRTLGTESASGTATFNGEIYLGGDLTVSAASGGTALFSGNITNAGNLTKAGNGIVTLSGANTFAGSVAVNAGTLSLSGGSAIVDTNAVSITTGATLNLASGETVGSIAGAGNISLNGNQLIAGQNNSSTLYSGVISSSADTASFVKKGTGTLTLSGANTMNGQSYLVGGTTLFTAAQGATFTNTINLGETFGTDAATLALSNGATLANPVTVRSGSGGAKTIQSLSTSGSNTISGAVTLNDTTTLDSASGGTLVLSAVVSGNSALTKAGAGTVIFSGGSANTYTNTTTINAGVLVLQKTAGVNALAGTPTINSGGTLRLGASDQFAGDTTFLTINSGGTFDLNGFNDSLALQGAGNITLGSGRLTINPGFTDTFSGVISGTGSVIKTNVGTQILSGSNTYSGGTLVAQGTLRIGAGGTSGSVAGDITNNGTVTFNRSDNITFGGVISGTGSLQKWGAGTLTLSGANTLGGADHYLIDGTMLFTVDQGSGFTGNLNLGDTTGGNSAALAIGTGGVTITNPVVVRSGSSGTMTISALNTSGTATFSGATTLNKSVTLSANSGGNLSLGAVTMGNNSITYSGANNVTIGGTMSATTSAAQLSVSGAGVMTLSGDNSASNQMKIVLNSGTLSVGALSAFGTVGGYYSDKINFNGGTLSVSNDVAINADTFGMTTSANGGTINVAANKTFTQNAWISSGNAAGTFNKTGSGTLVLGASTNALNPTFNIKAGAVQVAAVGALGTNVTTLGLGDTSTSGALRYTGGSATLSQAISLAAGGGTIDVSVAGLGTTLTVTNVVSGNGNTLTKAGESILALTNANTYGKTVISGGMLTVNADSGLGAAPGAATADSITIGNARLGLNGNFTLASNRGITLTDANSTIDVYGGNSATVSGVITNTGSGALTKLGLGTLTLSGANLYSGNTTVGLGVLQIGASNNLGTGSAVTISNGATFVLSSAAGFDLARSVSLSGNGAVSGAFVSAGGANTNSGGIVLGTNATIGVSAGSLVLSGNVTNSGNTLTVDTYGVSGTPLTLSGVVSGSGGLTKIGGGTATLSGAGANTYAGPTAVNSGVLNLNKTSGVNAIAGSVSVASGATLLLSSSGNVADSSAVTLSGGTIRRGGNVSEVFGNLSLTAGSFLDYGAGNAIGTLSFGTYTPSSLLTVQNFLPGNVLTFGSDLTSSINNASLFNLGSQGFTSSWNSGTSTFTITAIPEPSTYVAAVGLLAMFLWPSRRRLIKDMKSILGLRAPACDRLAH